MKNYTAFFLLLCSTICLSQNVGINTATPEATLDINGNAMIEKVPTAAVSENYDYMVLDPTTKEVQKVNGTYAPATNTTVAKAADRDGLGLLALGLFGTWQKIDFAPAAVAINPGSNFSTTTDEYAIPSTGIYEVTYFLRYGSGVNTSLLSNVKIGVLKDVGGTVSLLDEKNFDGISVALVLTITISSATIHSVYQLNAGDKISFALNRGGTNLSLLGNSAAEFVVKKISN